MEIILELTQEEADKVAEELQRNVRELQRADTYADLTLFLDVALALRNATRDARQRESDDDMHAWMNR